MVGAAAGLWRLCAWELTLGEERELQVGSLSCTDTTCFSCARIPASHAMLLVIHTRSYCLKHMLILT